MARAIAARARRRGWCSPDCAAAGAQAQSRALRRRERGGGFITRSRRTAKGSASTTTWRWPSACCCETGSSPCCRRRRGRPPGKRHGLHFRPRPGGLHVLDPPGAQLPHVKGARLAGYRPPRRHRRPRVPARAGAGAARRDGQPAGPHRLRGWSGPVHRGSTWRLSLTYEGLRGRDFLVLSSARDAGVPVVMSSRGYARRVEDTAAIHIATIEEAIRLGA